MSVSGEELDDAWNAFRNGWSMAVTGESKTSTEGAPDNKIHEEWKWNFYLLGYGGIISNVK